MLYLFCLLFSWNSNQTYTAKITSVCKVCVTANGCTNCSADLNVAVFALGINQLKVESEKLQVYPNPCGDYLRITIDDVRLNTIQCYDVLGREQGLYSPSQRGPGGFIIDVSKLTAGVYFLKLTDDKGNVRVGKFVKE